MSLEKVVRRGVGLVLGHTAFSAIMAAAEAVRVTPASTEAELRAQRQIVQRISGS